MPIKNRADIRYGLNIKALRWVADAIEDHELAKQSKIGFNLAKWCSGAGGVSDTTGEDCGTVACIAGWTAAMLKSDGTPRKKYLSADKLSARPLGPRNISAHAMAALDLSSRQACDLFQPAHVDRAQITPQQAVNVIRHLIATGTVDWRKRDTPRPEERGEYDYV